MTTTTHRTEAVDEEYLALVRAFPLRVLQDDRQLDQAISVVSDLLDRPELTSGERAYLDVLVRLIEEYQHAHVELPPVSGVEVLRHLMEENGLKQSDLAPLFGSPSIISAVLSGKRRLSLSHIRKLSDYFGLPADVFIDPPIAGNATASPLGARRAP